jgi:hypothetical protein
MVEAAGLGYRGDLLSASRSYKQQSNPPNATLTRPARGDPSTRAPHKGTECRVFQTKNRARLATLVTRSTKIVDVSCHGPVCIHGKVKILVKQEVIARTLPYYLEIVYRCLDERKSSHISLDAEPRDTCALIFVTTHRADTAYSLRLKMRVERNVVASNGSGDQHVKISIERYNFAGTAHRTRNKH